MIPQAIITLLLTHNPNEKPKDRDIVPVQLFDTYEVLPETTLEDRVLFSDRGVSKDYQNFGKAPGGRLYVLTGLKVIHNFNFVAADAETAQLEQRRFEVDSSLTIEVEDKKAGSVIPLTNAIPWQTIIDGQTTSVQQKLGQWMDLEDPIIIPPVGTFEVNLNVAKALATIAAADGVIPSLPNHAKVPDGLAFSMKVIFRGFVNRKVS